MTNNPFNFDLIEIKRDLHRSIIECNRRGLVQSVKWLSELNYGLLLNDKRSARKYESISILESAGIADEEHDRYHLGKSYFDCKEFERAAYFTRDCTSPVPQFINLYAQYMAKEKKRLDSLTDTVNLNESVDFKDLSKLLTTLKSLHQQRTLDGYCLYLYGIILKKLNLAQLAVNILLEAVHMVPTLWCAWFELAPLITEKSVLMSLKLPDHWMKYIFLGHAYIELFLNDEGLKQYEDLQISGFDKCVYVTSQIAIAYLNKRNVDKAISLFKELQDADPYRLDHLDTYSNLLFVKEMKDEMAFLAHRAVEINKYRPETCCVIGNYYSIRSDHQKAVTYFQRALKLNPQYLSAWTLMGHEFMEMKNTNAAIQSYRKAIEVNRRDYRAWYGLGQSYEILKMPCYSLFYYKKAQQLRPCDSRMLVALGEAYEKLEKNSNSLMCYRKACNVGDVEGIALLRLANLYEKLSDKNSAVSAYLSYVYEKHNIVDKVSLCHAFVYLGTYFESIGDLDEASYYAYKCLEHDDANSEAKSLLRQIAQKRKEIPVSKPNTTTTANDDIDVELSMDESDLM